jgi:predicted alpha/beta superfamily hydrolase
MLRILLSCLLSCACLAPAPSLAGEAPSRPHTAGPRVGVLAPPLRYAGFGFPRRLRIYVPPGYDADARRYPVIYLFDGQNLFDEATSYAGEWGVDEALDALARDAEFAAIAVGVDHGEALRFNELIPYFHLQFVPNKGAAFVRDVVDSIKPFVDANYRTRPQREHTAIIGSSLGGLAADYAIHAHPDVFSRAGVFSPSYWVSDLPFHVARTRPLPPDSRVFLYMGGREGDEAVSQVRRMAQLLRAHRLDGVELHIAPDAGHDEAAWRAVFPQAVRWLFEVR